MKYSLSIDKVSFLLLCGYGILAPVFFVPLATGIVSATDLLAPVGVMLCVMLLKRTRFSAESFFLLGYLFLVNFSTLGISSEYQADSVVRVLRYSSFFVPFFLVRSLRLSLDQLKWLFGLMEWAFLFSVLLGIIFFFLNISITDGQKFYFGNSQAMRAGGVFGNTGPYGLLCGIWFSIMMFRNFTSKIDFIGIFLLLGSLLVFGLSVYTSLSRAAILGGFLGIVVAFWMVSQVRKSDRSVMNRRMPVVLFFLFFGFLLVFLLAQTNTVIVETLVDRFVNGSIQGGINEISSGRLENWKLILGLLEKNPVTGLGYKSLIFQYKIAPDNNFLSIFAETGVLGLFFFLGFIFLCLKRLHRIVLNSEETAVLAARAFIFWQVVLIIAFTADVFTYWGIIPVLMLLTGALFQYESTKN
jgi:O-antigen ligase